MKSFFTRMRVSTFVRFALSYLLMLVIVLGAVFSYMFVYVRREVRDKALANQVNRLSRIANLNENYLSSMLNSAVQMGLSPVIQPFVYAQEPARAYDLLQQLAPYTVTNSFCDQMYLTFHSDDHIYSSTASMTLQDFLDMTCFEHLSSDELLSLIQNPGTLTMLPAQKVESPLINGKRTNVVTLLMPLGASPTSSKGTMIFMVRDQVYRQLFADVIQDANNTYILHDGEILISDTDYDIPVQTVLDAVPAAGNQTTFRWDGEQWHMLIHRSEGWPLCYVSLLRAADIEHTFWSRMISVSMVVSALAALGVLVALLLARRSTAPIQQIVSMLPDKDPAQDAFASIQTGIQELSARNTDLSTRLERSLPMQRHDFVLNFMKGRFAERAEAVAVAESIGMSIERPYYAIILHGVQDRSNHQPFDLRKPPFDQLTGTAAFGVELMAIKAHLYLVFSDTQEAIRELAGMIHQNGLERNGHAVVALSDIQTDFSAAPNAYLEAATAFDNRFVMDDSTLLDYASVSTSIEDILPQARKLTDSIHQAISLRDRTRLASRIDELLHFLKHTNMSPFAFRLIYNDVIDKLLRRHTQSFVAGRGVQAYYDIFTLSSCQSIDDLDGLLRRLCVSIIEAPEEEAPAPVEEEAPSVISQVAAYIRDHFRDPELSISAIAEAFDMPTARLSLAFKDAMRMSPLEYLTLLRVEHSKELLRGTEKSIKDIAAEVGYYDASSFIRRFKQMTGVTPLQYRRSKEDDNNAEG